MQIILDVRKANARNIDSPGACPVCHPLLVISSPQSQLRKATLGTQANALRTRLAAKTGFLHSQSKQPVLKIGLKPSVEGQAEMKSDKFGWRPKKAIIFW